MFGTLKNKIKMKKLILLLFIVMGVNITFAQLSTKE